MMAQLRNLFKPATPAGVNVSKLLGDIGWAESKLYKGDFPKYNPDELIGRRGWQIYRKMMLDEQVKAVVKFKRDAITSRDFYFALDDERLSESEAERRIQIYERMIDTMRGSFNDGLNFVMTAMYNGFSLTEQIIESFDYEGTPYIGLVGLMPKPFDTFSFKVDEFGNITECVQEIDGRTQSVDLSKFVYFTHNPEFDQHYGQSELREAYRSWYSKDVIIRLYNQFLERFAGGFVVTKPSEGMTLTQGSKEYNGILAALSNIRQQTSILLPSKMEMEVHQPASTDQFERAITMHDLQIAKALLVPNLMGITHQGDTGSFAQASVQLEAFLWTLDADAKRLKDSLNEQIFGPLGAINFADGIAPRIQFKPVSESKKFEVIKTWKELVQAKAVEATETDEAHLRNLLDFPEGGEPITKPAEPVVVNPANPVNPAPGAESDDDQTVLGVPSGALVTNSAFSRATKRVAFSVIGRKSTELESEHTDSIEERLAEMTVSLIVVIEQDKLGTPAGGLDRIDKIDFSGPDKTRARKAIDAALKAAWKLGIKYSTDEVTTAKNEKFSAKMERLDEMAADFLKTNGFRMLGNLTEDMRRIIQGILVNGVKYTWTTGDIVLKIWDALTREGFVSATTNAAKTGRSATAVQESLQLSAITPHRVATAVRTNVFEAINEARYTTFTDPALDGFVEAMEYSAILDSRTTDICTHLNGRVYPIDSDEWNGIRPPNHYNCRSLLVPVTIVDIDVKGKDAPKGSRWSKPPMKEPQKGFGA